MPAAGSRRRWIERSYLCGDEVADVGAIRTTLPGGFTVLVHGVFTYRGDGGGKLAALRAFWEFGSVDVTDAGGPTSVG
jgi:hypothetical protein